MGSDGVFYINLLKNYTILIIHILVCNLFNSTNLYKLVLLCNYSNIMKIIERFIYKLYLLNSNKRVFSYICLVRRSMGEHKNVNSKRNFK